ncbi:serine hydrolase domain-containing protein [Allosphingosinicella sp.]|uniref:serine hydrolase domain-containing protein n=1 Tax=Allosphingosinicella sp. TaxID=2823234 RepID=UPI002EFE8575
MIVSDPGALGFDPEAFARIDQWLADTYVDPGLLPCAQLLVAREGVPVHFTSQGVHRAGGGPLREDAIFRIASMTKPVTSIAFMMLVERGLTSLDTPVHRIIPELEHVEVYESGGQGAPLVTRPPDRPMLMIDLLRHTSGLTYDFQRCSPVDAAYRERGLIALRGELGLERFVAALGEVPLEFSPGTAWTYSVSTDVLGLVVQRLSGTRFEDYVEQRIFAPLGMADTGFEVPPDKLDRLTDAWMLDPELGTIVYDRGADSSWSRSPDFLSGGGGLVSTTADYHLFCRMLLGGGTGQGARLIGRKTLDLMTRNHLPGGADLTELSRSMFSEAIYSGQGYGLGFGINTDPAKAMAPGSAGEFYWGGIFSTYFFVDPVERVSAVFMTQLMPSSTYPVRRQLKTMIYSALL